MELVTVYVVLVASVAAVATQQLNDTTVTKLSKAFKQLVETQKLIAEVEKEAHKRITPALVELSGELQAGLDSDLAKFAFEIRRALVDVNIKIGQIAGNSSSLVAQIRSAAVSISTMKLNSISTEYKIKKKIMKRTCEDAFEKTETVLRLIDSVKSIFGNNVSVRSQQMNTMISKGSVEKINEYEQTIYKETSTSDSYWTRTFTPGAANAARELITMKQARIDKIRNLMTTLIEHSKWLNIECVEVTKEIDKTRNVIAKISGNVIASTNTLNITLSEIDKILFGEEITEVTVDEALVILVTEMKRLSDEITAVVESRKRRSVTLTPPLWFDQTISPDNGCVYIYNDRTTGCILNSTFEYMKNQHKSILYHILRFQETIEAFDGELKTFIKILLTNNSKLNSKQITETNEDGSQCMDMLGLILETDRAVGLLRDDVRKIQDLLTTFNLYADSLFSEAKAPKRVIITKDNRLNEGVIEFVTEILHEAKNLIDSNSKDEVSIKRQVESMRASPCLTEQVAQGPIQPANADRPPFSVMVTN